jgi:hypothetical protein
MVWIGALDGQVNCLRVRAVRNPDQSLASERAAENRRPCSNPLHPRNICFAHSHQKRRLSRVGSNRKAECGPFYGFSLSFHFRRDARTGRPTQAWRCLSRIVGTVPNWTVLIRSRCHHECSMKKKSKKKSGGATLASVKKEMAKPRRAKSAREGEINLAAGRMVPVRRGNTKLQLDPHPLLRRAR